MNMLNIDMDSTDINEAWVRKNFDIAKERKTSTRSCGHTADIDDSAFGFGPVDYNKFFEIVKSIVDAHILHVIVKNNITCDERSIKIQLEMTTSNWYGDADPSVYIHIQYKHRESNAEVIKRLITTNKRNLSALKRKTKKKNDMVEKINKLSDAERKALLAELQVNI